MLSMQPFVTDVETRTIRLHSGNGTERHCRQRCGPWIRARCTPLAWAWQMPCEVDGVMRKCMKALVAGACLKLYTAAMPGRES